MWWIGSQNVWRNTREYFYETMLRLNGFAEVVQTGSETLVPSSDLQIWILWSVKRTAKT